MGGRVLVFEPDLMFSSNIESLSRRSNLSVEVKVTIDELVQALRASTPTALVINLDATGGDFKSLPLPLHGSCKLIGYYSHVDSELAKDALENGFQVVIPRRALAGKLSDMFREFGSS